MPCGLAVASGQEAAERRGKRDFPLSGQAHGGSHHVLLGDEAREEALGADFQKLFSVGGILDISISVYIVRRMRFYITPYLPLGAGPDQARHPHSRTAAGL